MGESISEMVRVIRTKDLSFLLEAPEGFGMDHAVSITLVI
jgi:hypothetical protein